MSPSDKFWVHYRVRRLKYLPKKKQTFEMDLVSISKFSKTLLYHRNQRKNLVGVTIYFSKNMRSSSAFGDRNGQAYQIFTLFPISQFLKILRFRLK